MGATGETGDAGEGRKFFKHWVSPVPMMHVIPSTFLILGFDTNTSYMQLSSNKLIIS